MNKNRYSRKDSCARPGSWVRKRNYRKKLVRRFLSMNPAYHFTEFRGIRPEPAVWLNRYTLHNGKDYDPMLEYDINPYFCIYVSPRGDLRKYRGVVSFDHGQYALCNKNRMMSRITNRRLRRIPADQDLPSSFSACRKAYGPPVENGW